MAETTTPLLDRIGRPADLRQLDKGDLRQLADELRFEMIDAVSMTGGHLGAGLGVVELTVALHYVFDTPDDRLIWDVGHQAYPHKILTARRDRIRTLRQGGGLAGFTKRAESDYDPFGAGHSSTSISAGLGMAAARDLAGKDNNVVAVIGDGAMSAGMAFEAMNNAQDQQKIFQALGFPTQIKKAGRNRYQVIVGQANTFAEAQHMIDILSEKGHQVWINQCDCCKLTEEEHIQNRRTDFKIIRL